MKSTFNTMVLVSWHINNNEMPEKWRTSWNAFAYEGTLFINELLVSEIYAQIAMKKGPDSAFNCIMKI